MTYTSIWWLAGFRTSRNDQPIGMSFQTKQRGFKKVGKSQAWGRLEISDIFLFYLRVIRVLAL
ncbi:MAG: hypothetical protein SFU91_14015 [Chloroherpetonaceae bacterium]|nr:hypothetical protein [Chloroherpetonaceae bacterium]